MTNEITVKLTSYGMVFKEMSDTDPCTYVVDLREEDFHPWMWQTNAAEEAGL